MISLPVFTAMIWSIIALAWVGFLIIFVALVRDATSVVSGRRDRRPSESSRSKIGDGDRQRPHDSESGGRP